VPSPPSGQSADSIEYRCAKELTTALPSEEGLEDARAAWMNSSSSTADHDSGTGTPSSACSSREEIPPRPTTCSHGSARPPTIRREQPADVLLMPVTGTSCARPWPSPNAPSSNRRMTMGPSYFHFVHGLAPVPSGPIRTRDQRDERRVQRTGARSTLLFAMAQHRSGRVRQADKPLLRPSWHTTARDSASGARPQRLIYHVLRREAESLVLPDCRLSWRESTSPGQRRTPRLSRAVSCESDSCTATFTPTLLPPTQRWPTTWLPPTAKRRSPAALAGSGHGADATGLAEGGEARARSWRGSGCVRN